MYYPYLRGKQFELILLRENATLLAESKIYPIIEPVKSNFSALIRAMGTVNEEGLECTIIVNPKAGRKPPSTERILRELIDDAFEGFKNISIGYMLHAESTLSELTALLKKYRKRNFTILHSGYTNGKKLASHIEEHKNIKTHVFMEGFAGKLYQKQLKKDGIKRVLIRDGFKAQQKNSLYPRHEHFSELHITYKDEEGMDGFGDYLTVGSGYTETGGPAYAVAIHLTYLDDEDMFIYHFVSDQTKSPADPGGKFLEALSKLVKKVNASNSNIYRSRACKEYLKLFAQQHYPGLGYVKKLSMQHHIELIADYIEQTE